MLALPAVVPERLLFCVGNLGDVLVSCLRASVVRDIALYTLRHHRGLLLFGKPNQNDDIICNATIGDWPTTLSALFMTIHDPTSNLTQFGTSCDLICNDFDRIRYTRGTGTVMR